MPFCSNCGNQLADSAAFCGQCGTRAGGSAAPGYTAAPPIPVEPIQYTIQGDNLQIARVQLKPGQQVYAEAGKMVYKTSNVTWSTEMSGATLGEKLIGALKRKLAGQSLFLTYFRSMGDGDVGFAGSYPGKIQAFDLAPGQSILCERNAFLLAESSVQFSIAFTRRIGAGFFGGEGFILEQLTGPGIAFIHAGGDFVEFDLAAGESIQVETGCIVAFDASVDYDIQLAGGIKTAVFGGEGLFLATLTGPGRVIVQSMTLHKLRRELAPGHTGGDERKGIDVFSNLFGSDD